MWDCQKSHGQQQGRQCAASGGKPGGHGLQPVISPRKIQCDYETVIYRYRGINAYMRALAATVIL